MILKPSLNVYSKTEQILSRYRPIAPKPLVEGPPTPDNAQHSPFSKNHSSQSYLLPRPSRGRKRGKASCSPSAKRAKTSYPSTQLGLSLQGFGAGHGFPTQFPVTTISGMEKPLNLVTLPFLPYPATAAAAVQQEIRSVPELDAKKIYSLGLPRSEVPQEMDLLHNLHVTDSASFNSSPKVNVVVPLAVRLVGSSISVEYILQQQRRPNEPVPKKPEEVEAEIEMDSLPAVVSDSCNRVRLVNSAYMEMVGQPECLWLDSMVCFGGQARASTSKRIGGKVVLGFSDTQMLVSSDGFTCKAKIEWGINEKKSSIAAQCDVVKLSCESKDYLFTWRFHTLESTKSDSKA